MTLVLDRGGLDLEEVLDSLTRREFVIGAAAVGLTLTGCGRNGQPATTTAEAGPWSFVDDRGVEVSLPSTPTRIVAEADAAAALWDLGIRPVGIFGTAPLDQVQQLEHVDLDAVESLGESYGEINLEKLAALDPDLIVAVWYAPDEILYGMKNEAQQRQLEEIAPTVGIDAHVVADVAIDRMGQLAESLGADLDAPEIRAERERFQRAGAALSALSSDKPLRVMAVYPATDELYVLVPEDSADLALLEQLGVDLVDPDTADPYYEIISWEHADRYPADVIVMDERVFQGDTGGFADLPTWTSLPAVEAGQVGSWISPAPFSYRALADVFETMSALLERSESVAG
jgi:iron complex transport system substrate-binding protein